MDEIYWSEKIGGFLCLPIYAKFSEERSQKSVDKLKYIGTAL